MDAQPAPTEHRHSSARRADPSATGSLSELVDRVAGFALRQYPVFVVVTACALALGVVYLIAAPPQYTATATLLIDSNKARALQGTQPSAAEMPLDAAQVDSQVELLKSASIARAVIQNLDLAHDPEFGGASGGLMERLRRAFGGSDSASEEEAVRRALAVFSARRSIARIGRTYVLQVSFTSLDPARSAQIANAIADAYIVDQLEAKYQAIRRASAWLQDRIKELKAQASAADRAVLEYKESKNIVDIGGAATMPGAGNGRLIGEQQLTELNTQLVNARVATSEARARLERIEQVLKLDVGEAAVAESLRNEVITRLRNQYVDLAAREATWAARYGRDHQAAVNLRSQMDEVRRNISDELNRVAASYRSDYEIAKTRQENLERDFAALVTEGQATNRDRLALIELEGNAKIYRTLYDNFLQRYTEAIQQQSFPITEARVIGPASVPRQKSKPVTSLVLAVAGTLGLLASIGVAALREATDGAFRTTRQVADALGVSCIAMLPAINPSAVAGPAVRRTTKPFGNAPPPGDDAPSSGGRSHFAVSDMLMRHVLDRPLSPFTEGCRAIKIAAELRAGSRNTDVIGVTSTLPGEGKSTVACNLAELMADAGKRVLLMDADLRNPTLARSLRPLPAVGLMEVINGQADLAQAIGIDRTTGLAFLPTLRSDVVLHFDAILSSNAFRRVLEELRPHYDYIVVDLPPLAPVVDVRAVASAIDTFVFVVEWGATKMQLVQDRLTAEPDIHDRLLGVVLNKADLRRLGRFEPHGLFNRHYDTRYGYLD